MVLRMKLFNADEVVCVTVGIIEKRHSLCRYSSYLHLRTIDILGYQPLRSDHVSNERQDSVI
jgi:hypothetical protein